MFRSCAGLREHGDDIPQRLLDLGGERTGHERAGLVPADLPGHEDKPPGRLDAVGVAPRLRPTRWLQAPHPRSRRTLRWTLPVGVRGRASTNSTRRGYL